MKYLITLIVLLAGCSTTVPVKRNFPDVPQSMKVLCTELKKIEGDVISIVDLHKTVVENYMLYHECAVKVDAWHEWHRMQKEIVEGVK
jgi:hypothetical protein